MSSDRCRHEERKRSSSSTKAGIGAFVRYLDRAKTSLDPRPISVGRGTRIGIEVALEWNDSYYEQVLCFTNNIPQRDGGTHLAAFRAALTRTINDYADKSGLMKSEKVSLTGEDMREGLTAIVSVKLPDPKFTAARPRTSWSAPRCASRSKAWWARTWPSGSRRTPAEARIIIQKIVDAAAAREGPRKARET